jgi:hypothetical protein
MEAVGFERGHRIEEGREHGEGRRTVGTRKGEKEGGLERLM